MTSSCSIIKIRWSHCRLIFIIGIPIPGRRTFDWDGALVFASSHYGDFIMGAIPSQITSLTIVYSTVYSDADQRKHQSSASLAYRGPVNSPHKWPLTRKMFPFDDVIMSYSLIVKALFVIYVHLCLDWWVKKKSHSWALVTRLWFF